ncbi:MAG TPA: hypothetical protein VHZ28_08390 [Terracidiphilus sp.]|jgi:hypothetical protein|nr:hypothetical protein [Terracidiphilus sp.]
MKYTALLIYQWITGLSDTGTGVLLYVAPLFTLRLMGVHAPQDATPYISYIGAFVLSVGLACLYGVRLVARRASEKLQVVWLLTTFTRSAVAIYLIKCILAGDLEPAWITVALFDAACAVIQGVGLRKRWLAHAY